METAPRTILVFDFLTLPINVARSRSGGHVAHANVTSFRVFTGEGETAHDAAARLREAIEAAWSPPVPVPALGVEPGTAYSR
jgi:hypothetical protein